MKIFEYSRIFLLVLVFFLIIDGLVIGLFMSDFYERELINIAKTENGTIVPLWTGIALVYVLLSIGLAYVIVCSENDAELKIFLKGCAFGFVLYGIYNITNYSLLNGWSLNLALLDISWGAILSGTVALFASLSNKFIGKKG